MPTRETIEDSKEGKYRNPFAQYFVNVAVAINQFFQTLLSPLCNLIDERRLTGPYGDPDDTFCSVVGRYYRYRYGGKVPWTHPLAAFIQHLTEFWLRDKGHTEEATEDDEGADAPGKQG